MNDRPVTESKTLPATWVGLFLALFGILIIRQVCLWIWPSPSFTWALWKESLVWLCAIVLLILVRRGERLPLTSIGLGRSRWWKSVLWGIVLAVICGGVAGALAGLGLFTGVKEVPGAALLAKLPLWLVALIILRAGVVEELFYRGYAIERLQAMGLHRYLAAAIPLVIFGAAHWPLGWPLVANALAVGTALTAFYLWRRDLAANMIAHFLVDFAGILLPRVLSHP